MSAASNFVLFLLFLQLLVQHRNVCAIQIPSKVISGDPVTFFATSQFGPFSKLDSNNRAFFSNNIEKPLGTKRDLTDFSSRDSRQGFIRKVYSICSVQMISTILFVGYMMKTQYLTTFLLNNAAIVACGTILGQLGIISVLAATDFKYRKPYNFILLGAYTLLQSVSTGIFAAAFDPQTVIVGALHTLTAIIGITLYSFQPNSVYDLSMVYLKNI
jgi:FtsH-binding integral membrane protein